MKKKIIPILLPFALLGYMMFQGGCVKENFDTIPNVKDTSLLVTSASIADVKALLTNTGAVSKVKGLATPAFWQKIVAAGAADSSIVVEGYVTTSDSTGNFYKVFTIQDATGGIDIRVNSSDLSSIYRLKPGQAVKVKMNDLYLGYYMGVYQIGSAIVELGVLKLVEMSTAQLSTYIERTGYRKKLIPDTLTVDQINASYIQKYVCIKNVQFKDPFNAYSVPGVNTDRTLIDCNGNMLILRTSGYATFAQDLVPTGNGTITGVLSTYGATLQFYIRDLNDIKFSNPRCGLTAPTPNTTIAALKAMCTSTSLNITTDVVISGVVNANDESGNLFKQLDIQDETAGIAFSINISGMYPEYPVGTKLVINCKGLCIGKYGNSVELGGLPYSTYVARLDPATFYRNVFTVETGVAVTPVETTISAINDNLVGKLISLDDVQFRQTDLGKSWSDPSATANRYIEDVFENSLIVRTSNYANFANNLLPSGRGKITAVLSKYNTDYQLTVRDLNDIRLIKPRFDFILSQNFSLASLGSAITTGGWQTSATAGTKIWTAKITSGNTYAEMNPFNSGEPSNTGWLISPQVNLAGYTGKTLIFQTAFNNWSTNSNLEVFISTDFNGTDINSATWTSLSGAQLVKQTDGANIWVNSGNVDLSQYNGNIYLGFKYTSTGGTSATAFRVDNVKIFAN